MPKPVITAVNGPAVGIGCSFALACDLILAAESAYLMLAFVNIGLVPDGGSSFLIPERAGFARAAEMAMLGEKVPAGKALEWGLINRVIPTSAPMDEAEALAERLANGPTGPTRAPSASSTTGRCSAWRSSSSSRRASSRRWPGPRTSSKGVTAFVRSARRASTGR